MRKGAGDAVKGVGNVSERSLCGGEEGDEEGDERTGGVVVAAAAASLGAMGGVEYYWRGASVLVASLLAAVTASAGRDKAAMRIIGRCRQG